MVRLKPVKFIAHKLGPFEHLELDWDKDSRYTLIVGENGMGKTTLVAAMAACLSFGNENLFPDKHFERFAHNEESFACLEINLDNKTGWLLRWTMDVQNQRDRTPGLKLPVDLPTLGTSSSLIRHPGEWSPNLAPIIQNWRTAPKH